MVREIVNEYEGNKSATMLIHRYNTRDDTFIEYYRVNIEGAISIYKNTWVAKGNTETYRKPIQLTENEKALVQIGKEA